METTSTMHITMFPWFAFGHLIPFLQISNKLAKKGHKISFFTPSKTSLKLQPYNLFPNLITFVPITVPHVDGLPLGAETTADVSQQSQLSLIMTSMDRTQPEIHSRLRAIKPDAIFFDFAHWVPELAHELGIKSIYYAVSAAVSTSYVVSKLRELCGQDLTIENFMHPPNGFPSSSIKLHAHEAQHFASLSQWRFGSDILFFDRHLTAMTKCNALAIKSCREIEGPFIDYLKSQLKKPVLLSGTVDLQPPTTTALEERWDKWLAGFNSGSVIYCAFGSECFLTKHQYQELLLGLELSNAPFFAVLKPPLGIDTVHAALPEGFEQRIQGRGVVYGGWVQQQLILEHPAVGCFVTHCGSGSLSEAMTKKCQLVMVPQISDHFLRARLLGNFLRVGVEVEKGEKDGIFTKESVGKAVKIVMDEENEIGKEIRANLAKLRELLLNKDLEESYINNFIHNLQALVQ